MSKKYATKQFNIAPSPSLTKGIAILHGLAVIVAVFIPLPIIYKIIALVLILGSLIISLKQENISQEYILRYSTIYGWKISELNHYFDSIEILPSTVLTPYIVFFHYRKKYNGKQKTKTMVILKDALTDDSFRQLRVELRISGLEVRH
ncbi:MAG: hypothetical protein KAH20_08910 [Methylococcales bacterium]|nr:hypothetical protein [Methylococcales bacterium]